MRSYSPPRALAVALAAGLALIAARAGADSHDLPDGLYAEFSTPRGTFTVSLNYRETPMTCASFVGLAEGAIEPRDGKPFYTGLRWYRVVPGFVIQSGDPTHAPDKPDSPDDPGHPYQYPDEFVPGLRHDRAGILSMANAGPDTNSSEFFVTLADTTRLNYLHSVFGHTVRGADMLQKIGQGDEFSIRILRVGEEAAAFKADEAAFKALAAAAPKYSGAAEPGPAAHFDDAARVLPTEVPRAKNFNYKLANFERATGRRVYARVLPAIPPADGEEKADVSQFTRTLARELGLDKDGVLAVYTASTDEWFVWVGDDLLGTFNPSGGRLHERKVELYDAVKKKAAFYTEEARRIRGPERPLTPADLAKYSVDAMLDALIFIFEPAAAR